MFCSTGPKLERLTLLLILASLSGSTEKSFLRLIPVVNVIKVFPSSLMMMPNKLEGFSLENLSSQVLEFEGKARANPIGGPFRCFLPG
jgi:hypothetical protein